MIADARSHSGQSPMLVRQAILQDAASIAELIAAAFRDDPILRWLIPDARWRHGIVADYFRSAVRHLYLPHEQVYLTEDVSGAALCLPAGVTVGSPPLLDELGLAWRLCTACGLGGLLRAHTLQATVHASRPAEPHFYVHALGVRPSQQGRGVGSALLRQVTGHCDRCKFRAYLENTNERNLPLYERYGFRVLGTWHASNGGPTIWFMARDYRHATESMSAQRSFAADEAVANNCEH